MKHSWTQKALNSVAEQGELAKVDANWATSPKFKAMKILLIGKAYTAMLELNPGNNFTIKLGRKQIRLIPEGAEAPKNDYCKQNIKKEAH